MNLSLLKAKFKIKQNTKKQILKTSKTVFWFLTGALLTLIFVTFFGFFAYEKYFDGKVFPGVYVNSVDLGGKTKNEINNYFADKNAKIADVRFSLTSDYGIATVSAKEIDFGFDEKLSSEQAYSIGRSGNFITDLSIILQAYFNGIKLPATYMLDQNALAANLKPVSDKINLQPVNAVFRFENGRVGTFVPSSDGQEINLDKLTNELISHAFKITEPRTTGGLIKIQIPITILKPSITTEKANSLGIKELIGEGHSLFYHSIPGRIHNVNLAASRINGVLIAPDEVFSFDKALGDVSAFTGYQQAYVIQNGKTVLGDGGGVCQVSTTFFRAVLNSGLPIVERHAHAYRVGYYEEDSPPGIDATVFVPSVDFKFKNDTGYYILVQSAVDLDNLSLTFYFYGTKDGRTVTMTTPVVTNQSPPPPTLYQDDPTLPKGQTKQTDFAAWGADVVFTRTVTKNGKNIIFDKFVSNYRPWQASYLVGTKE
jgi:vancomycin resistance protein YoaR